MKAYSLRLLQITGFVVAVSGLVLAGRLVWEQTVWSWDEGPQMVGFSLMHSGLGVLLLLALFAGLAWIVLVLIFAIWSRSFGGPLIVCLVLAYGISWAVVSTPYGFWQRLFIDRFSAAIAREFFTYDAAVGDTRTVEAFLQRGMDINVQGREGTALHGAAVEGRLDTIEFLLSHGADVNAINAYGDSPLANAMAAKRNAAEAQALLIRHGAKNIRGSEAQRDRVIKEQVREDIEKMDERLKNR